MDEEKGYLATDGTFVATEPATPLPDGEIDLNSFRQTARASAEKAAGRSYIHLFGMLYQEFDTRVAPKMSASMFRRIESILMQARAHCEANANANADALIDCLASPETAGAFQSILPSVLGSAALTFAQGDASWMEREFRWVLQLLESLPPARLAPAISEVWSGYRGDPFRPFFHEPFLNGPYGDLRHLEGSAPLAHSRSEFGIYVKPPMMGGTSEALKATRTPRRNLAELKKESPPSERIVAEVLGVDLKAGELEEFRMIGALLQRAALEARPQMRKPPRGAFAAYYLRYGGSKSGLTRLPPELLARYISERFDVIDLAFGLGDEPATDHGYQPRFAAELLRHLPKTPNRYKDALYRLALGRKRSGRIDAQRLLKDAQGLASRLGKSLNAKSKDERVQAAACLGRSGNKAAGELLAARIAKEKNVEVRNSCIAALRALGEEVTVFSFDRAALVEEARNGLGKPLPEKRAFLADLDLPDLVFDNGAPAPLELGPWLVRYATDMGLPSRNELLNLRLIHLDESSRVALAQAVLEGWVRHDTLMWKDLSFQTHRVRFEPEMYQMYLGSHARGVRWYRHRYVPGKPPKTPAEHAADISPDEVEEFLRNKTSWGRYISSSYDAKGALALCCVLPGSEIRKTLRFYLKDHSGRGPQIKVLMSLLADCPGKTPIKELTKIAGTQKQKSLRQHAIDLLDDLSHPYSPPAEDQGAARSADSG